MKPSRCLLLGCFAVAALSPLASAFDNPKNLCAHDNLFAWCTVPFDARARGPEDRAAMLEQLGFTMFAYDWRDKDIPTFDAEIEALQKHHIKLTAWWFSGNPADPSSKQILEACKRHNVHPQLWVANGGPFAKTPEQQKQFVDQMANQFKALDTLAKPYGCHVEIYNHNGWGGNEDNELAVIDKLKEMGVTDVGMVYNFSHAHDGDHNDSVGFPELWKRIQPHVVAVNVAGMNTGGGEVYPSQGVSELAMLRTIEDSGWQGPVGLIAEQGGDAAITLANCIKGVDWLTAEIKSPGEAGPKPAFKSSAIKTAADNTSTAPATDMAAVDNPAPNLVEGKFGKGLDASNGGLSLTNTKDEARRGPITVELWAKLSNATGFNDLVTSDPKSSGEHWELYSYINTGCFAVYLPGRSAAPVAGEEVSTAVITDNAWHYLAMTLETGHLRLYVDGKMVLEDKAVLAPQIIGDPGNIGIGQLAEGGNNAQGVIDDVRISSGILPIPVELPKKPLKKEKSTLFLWNFDGPTPTSS